MIKSTVLLSLVLICLSGTGRLAAQALPLSAKASPQGSILGRGDEFLCNSAAQLRTSGMIILCDLVMDRQGSIYICGQYSTSIHLGLGVELSGGTNQNYFLAKYDSSGRLAWEHHILTPGAESRIGAICLDEEGNVYIAASASTAFFPYTIDFGQGHVLELSRQFFVAKLSSAGKILWIKPSEQSNSGALPNLIAVDREHNVIISGTYYDKLTFGGTTLSPDRYGHIHVFLARLDSNARPVWARSVGSGYRQSAGGLVCDDEGSIYLAGSFYDSTRIGDIRYYSKGREDAYIIKFDRDGSTQWGRHFGGDGEQKAQALAMDNSGNLVFSGTFMGPMHLDSSIVRDFRPGELTGLLLKTDKAGKVLWYSLGGGSFEERRSLAVDSRDNIYLSFTFSDLVEFPDGQRYQSYGSNDVLVTKYDPDGGLDIVHQIANAEFMKGDHVACRVENEPVAAGSFNGTIDFGNGISLSRSGTQEIADVFITRFKGFVTDVNEPSVPREFSVYPNPAREKLFVRAGEHFSGSLILNDQLGRELLRCAYSGDTMLDLSGFGPGICLLRLLDSHGDQLYSTRICVEK